MIFLVLSQHSLSPEIGVHGIPVENYSRSGSGGVNLSRFSAGLDLNEPPSSKWSNTTSIKFEVHTDIFMNSYNFEAQPVFICLLCNYLQLLIW